MIFDLDMIKAVYKNMPARIAKARKVVNRPLTLSEKILFSHLHGDPAFAAMKPPLAQPSAADREAILAGYDAVRAKKVA